MKLPGFTAYIHVDVFHPRIHDSAPGPVSDRLKLRLLVFRA